MIYSFLIWMAHLLEPFLRVQYRWQTELRNLYNKNFVDSYLWNLSSAKLRHYIVNNTSMSQFSAILLWFVRYPRSALSRMYNCSTPAFAHAPLRKGQAETLQQRCYIFTCRLNDEARVSNHLATETPEQKEAREAWTKRALVAMITLMSENNELQTPIILGEL